MINPGEFQFMFQLDQVFFCLDTPLRNTSNGLHILLFSFIVGKKETDISRGSAKNHKKYDLDDVMEQRRHATFHFKLLRNPERED